MQAAKGSPELSLHRWVPESAFWPYPDTFEYQTPGWSTGKRKVIPDGFFAVRRALLDRPGVCEELAFLLEMDMGTEDKPRFAREKVRPGVAYLKSRAYKEQLGVDYGRWLVVTTSQMRLNHRSPK